MRLFLTACVIGLFLAGPMAALGEEKPAKEKPAKEDSVTKKEPAKTNKKAMKKNGGAGPGRLFEALPDPCLKNSNLPGCKGVQ